MRLRNVSFRTWLASHTHKQPTERWLRELYPWPVFAQVECDEDYLRKPQLITYDEQEFTATLKWVRWQPSHNTYRYRVHIESEGLGWHSRSLSDSYDMCGGTDGSFVTLFHTKKKEPLERIARAFFSRRWNDISQEEFKSLAVSRFLTASIVSNVIDKAYEREALSYYPMSRLVGPNPMFADESALWIGYRFFSENAYHWTRKASLHAQSVVCFYFADTKYQFDTTIPKNASVIPITEVDECKLAGENQDLIRVLLRQMELPSPKTPILVESIVRGLSTPGETPVSEADVHEALAVLKLQCCSKNMLRYQLAAAVVINAWIDQERKAGFVQRKKFYAFKQKIPDYVAWIKVAKPEGVSVWTEPSPNSIGSILFIRVDGVDFSFHAIPNAEAIAGLMGDSQAWSGIRLKPIAPYVLLWARLEYEQAGENARTTAQQGATPDADKRCR